MPLFAKRVSRRRAGDGARRFGEVLSVFGPLVTLLLVTIVAEIFHAVADGGYRAGFRRLKAKSSTSRCFLTRVAFPYLLFMSLVAMLSGVLNSLGRFAAAAAAPIVLNIVLITVLSARGF